MEGNVMFGHASPKSSRIGGAGQRFASNPELAAVRLSAQLGQRLGDHGTF